MHIPDPRAQEVAARYFKPFVERFRGCKSVIDIASGQGHFLDLMKAAGIPAKGIELDEGLCQQCKERDLEVIQGSFFTELEQTRPGTYDGAQASHIIEHFSPQQVEDLFRLLGPTLSPGSLLIVITPNPANLRRMVGDFYRDPTHVRPYPISAIKKLLNRAGNWEFVEGDEYTDRKPSWSRKITYAIRNALIGRYWVGDDLYVIARKVAAEKANG